MGWRGAGGAIGHTFGVRVHRFQKVHRVQRVVVAASPQIRKKGAAFAIGHTFGVRVDGPPARGLWPPVGGRLCRRVV